MVNSRCFILMKNRVKPLSQLFNSWGCNIWGRGWGVPLPSRLGVWGSVVISCSGVWGRAPAEKRVLEYLELEKNTWFHFPWLFPDFPFSLTFPWPLWNSLTFPGFPGEWSPSTDCSPGPLRHFHTLSLCRWLRCLQAELIFCFLIYFQVNNFWLYCEVICFCLGFQSLVHAV